MRPHSSQVLGLDVTCHEHLPVSVCKQGGAVCEALAAGQGKEPRVLPQRDELS